MLRIRLRRTGRSKAPQYRVVVADQRAPRDGDFVEIVGHYNPRSQPKELVLKEERVRHWLAQGAQPSETVHRLLHKQGLIERAPPQRDTQPSRADREAAAAATAEAEASVAATAAAATAQAEAAATAEAATPAEGSTAADGGATDDDAQAEPEPEPQAEPETEPQAEE